LSSDNSPVSGNRFMADVHHAEEGFICFIDGKVVDEKLVAIAEGREISRSELADHGPYSDGDGWKQIVSLRLQSIETAELSVFKSTSMGGRSACASLMTKYGSRCDLGKYGNPIVELSDGNYKHKTYGTVAKPEFRIVSWLDDPGLIDGGAVPATGGPLPKHGGTTSTDAAVEKPGEEHLDDEIPF